MRAKIEGTNATTRTAPSRVKETPPKTSAPTAAAPRSKSTPVAAGSTPVFINDAPSDNRRHVYSPSKSMTVVHNGSTDEFKLATPSVYTASTQPVSSNTRKPLENQRYTPANHSVKSSENQRCTPANHSFRSSENQRYTPANHTVRSSGQEEENVVGDCVDNALFSVASFTSVALESVAALILDCNQQYTRADV